MLVVGSSQSRWAGSGIPRRARVSGTHRHVAQPGNKPQLSRGRSPTAARTLSRVDEDAPAAIDPFLGDRVHEMDVGCTNERSSYVKWV